MASRKRSAVRKVFLSSTARDLGPYREAVSQAIARLDGFQCVRMEDFGARDWEADGFCRARVAECDVFVALIGHLFGSSPPGLEVSFTEREHQAAIDSGVPRLLFLASDDLPLPASLREPDDLSRRQLDFRERIRQEKIVDLFDNPDRLEAAVVAALRNLEREIGPPETEPAVASTGIAPEALRTAYLSRLAQHTSQLSLAGIDPAAAGGGDDAGLSLDAVYTALLTQSPREDGLSPPRPSMLKQRPLSALEQLNRHRRLVLLGDPGGGKSTFVNFVALCLVGEILGSPHAGLDLLRAPLPDDQGDDEESPQPWDHGPLLPVRVVLRDFAARGLPAPGERASARYLWTFIAETLAEASLGGYAPHLEKELQEKGGLLLLDGLDEVPEAESRREQIREAVEDFVASFGRCRVLLTSRTYAYQNQGWKLRGFTEAVLAPFSEGQIRRFVSRWYAQTASLGRLTAADAEGKAEHLREAIFGRPHLRELAERPLLLTLMASLHAWRGEGLPEKREQLYADTVELLLNRWESHRVIRDAQGKPVLIQPSLAQYLEAGKEKVRAALEELAFDVHSAQGDRPGTADVAEGDLVARLMRLRRTPETNPAVLVDYLSQRAGLLVPRGVGVFTFPHRTFQEYLAACHLTVEDFPAALAELGRQDPSRWREVVLLAAAKAARGSPASVWHLAHELCFREPEDAETGLADTWGAHLAGQAVAESVDLTRKLGEASRRQLELLRRWHLHLLRTDSLPAAERALAGKTLAKLGDPRFDPDLWFLPKKPLLGFIEIPAGSFRMGEGKAQHEVELPAFYMARYPVTVAQFRAFVNESGHESHPEALEGVANHPVTIVSWHDAVAYCGWLTGRLRETAKTHLATEDEALWQRLARGELTVALPSKAEGEKAARGTDGKEYPWGPAADPERANYYDTGILEPSTVGCFPGGASPCGCEEMSGNVWEWTRSRWNEEEASGPHVLRGGSCLNLSGGVRCAVRRSFDPAAWDRLLGFRVVLLPLSPDL